MKRTGIADVTVIGSGSWATAIVKLLCTNASTICWFVQFEEELKVPEKISSQSEVSECHRLQT